MSGGFCCTAYDSWCGSRYGCVLSERLAWLAAGIDVKSPDTASPVSGYCGNSYILNKVKL